MDFRPPFPIVESCEATGSPGNRQSLSKGAERVGGAGGMGCWEGGMEGIGGQGPKELLEWDSCARRFTLGVLIR